MFYIKLCPSSVTQIHLIELRTSNSHFALDFLLPGASRTSLWDPRFSPLPYDGDLLLQPGVASW